MQWEQRSPPWWSSTPGAACSAPGSGLGAGLRTRSLELLDALIPVVVDLILDRIDLTALVMRRVDLDAVAAGLDIREDPRPDRPQRADRAARRPGPVAAGLDLDGVAAGLDLDRIAARLDVDAVAARLDIDRVMARVDLIGLAEFVVDGIDLPRIIRESTAPSPPRACGRSVRGAWTRTRPWPTWWTGC